MLKEKTKGIFHKVADSFHTDDVFWRSEVEGNRLVALVMLFMAVQVVIVWTLNHFGFFSIDKAVMNRVAGWGLIELLVPVAVCRYFKGEKRWLKYLMVLEFLIVMARFDSLLTFNVPVAMAIGVVLSIRYYSRKFTVQVAAATTLLFAVSAVFATAGGTGMIDLNFFYAPVDVTVHAGEDIYAAFANLPVEDARYVHDYLLQSFLPRLMSFLVISIACAEIAKRGHDMVLEQAEISSRTARIELELSLAADIQAHMLPCVFPAFPEYSEFDLYATMDPAKEVGGDFYDYFMADETHLAIVVADVSGKGVPAALFMVIAKTLLKDHAKLGLEPKEVFTRVNDRLCKGNEAGLFVTAWMGILDITTGKMTYVNAGHNPPMIRHSGGEFTFLKSRPGLVLAGMEGMQYRQAELTLAPGDRMFLYTDGVTEATNSKDELYGAERLAAYLNTHKEDSLTDTLTGLRGDVDAFVAEAEQFDDITMLMMEYRGGSTGKVRVFHATDAALADATAFVEQELEKVGCPRKVMMQISLCLEEMFVNIAHYAYRDESGTVELFLDRKDRILTLKLIDQGIPFNPLEKEDPDITLAADEREVGGLGIYMVKQTMDEVSYHREGNQNIIEMKKQY